MLSVYALCALPSRTQAISLTDGWSTTIRGGARSAIRIDPIDLQIVHGTFVPPTATGNGWTKATADKDGSFSSAAARGGYFAFTVNSDSDKVMLLSSQGNTTAFINGQPRGGDVYMTGYVSSPIPLHKGANSLVFACGRGSFKANLTPITTQFAFDTRDLTAPDILNSDKGKLPLGVVLQNATASDLNAATIEAVTDRGRVSTPISKVLAYSNLKVGCDFIAPKGKTVTLTLKSAGKAIATTTIELRRRDDHQPYKRTFWSNVDHSVQYYGVNPSTLNAPNQALFLSLHGAGVEGIGQAEAYSPKSWGYIAAATNRRPFGFDWEDIGRLDAIEVLEDAQKRFKTDPTKTYLTGHSMGGHGTWQVGAHFPDKFAAIMPSAGWISFATYGGGARYSDPTPVEKMLLRGAASSDTLALKHNYSQEAIYVLHGDADDNVPVTEARTMRKELGEFHQDLHWFEQKGAGHWWDASPEPGADCVDWAAGFDLFSRRRLPLASEMREIDFTTECPGVNARSQWLQIDQQEKPFEPTRVQIRFDPGLNKYTATTTNAHAITLLNSTKTPTVEIDGDKLESKLPLTRTLVKLGGHWTFGDVASSHKSPARSGGFKSVFNHQVVAVYGTHGTAEENAWSRDKARFDAETLWIRGNGTLTIVSDVEFDPGAFNDRNVVIYGNRTSNGAYAKLIEVGDFDVTEGNVKVGEQTIITDAAVFAIRPRKDSNVASVAVVGGTSIVGMRLTTRASYFQSGSGFPDCLILAPDTLKSGTKGVIAAGFFGNDWSVKNGEFAWQK